MKPSDQPGREPGEPGDQPMRQPAANAYTAIVRRVSSPGALWLSATWGWAEAILFFIVPDLWLGFVALYAPRRMLVTLGAIMVGAALGAVCLYVATLAFGADLSAVIVALPGSLPTDVEQARAELAEQGAIASLNGVLQALPVKTYIHASALEGIGLVEVVVFTLLNRIERLLLFGVVMALVGWLGRRFITRWPVLAAGLYLAAWVIFYAVFLLSRTA